jgi:UDP-N-acetylmuramate dehydrogenase
MRIEFNKNLKSYNSFGLPIIADKFIEINNSQELINVLKQESNVLFLGGGSNILFKQNPKETVVHLNLKGIEITRDEEKYVEIRVAAGEDWNEFVNWTLSKNLGGLENLSLIPGNVGSSPIQNIGAYGREVKDFITYVEGIELSENSIKKFDNRECNFGYRNSIFKQELKGKFVITHVNFKLFKADYHKLSLNYGIIKQVLLEEGINEGMATIQNVSDAVVKIRSSKLPDPKITGNAGSFFKNPVISTERFLELQADFPEIPHYPAGDKIKIPAAWLIDNCGLKGYEINGAQINPKQPLVLINKSGKTDGESVWKLAEFIIHTVYNKFNIKLNPEVNIYPDSFKFF